MKYVRVMLYHKKDRRFTTMEECYAGDDLVEGLQKFLKYYPEHKDALLSVEVVDDEDEKWKEYFKIARECGAVHNF